MMDEIVFEVPQWMLNIFIEKGHSEDVVEAVNNLRIRMKEHAEIVSSHLHEQLYHTAQNIHVTIRMEPQFLQTVFEHFEVREDKFVAVFEWWEFKNDAALNKFKSELKNPIQFNWYGMKVTLTPAYIWWGGKKHAIPLDTEYFDFGTMFDLQENKDTTIYSSKRIQVQKLTLWNGEPNLHSFVRDYNLDSIVWAARNRIESGNAQKEEK